VKSEVEQTIQVLFSFLKTLRKKNMISFERGFFQVTLFPFSGFATGFSFVFRRYSRPGHFNCAVSGRGMRFALRQAARGSGMWN
jgi:hypothetical protein